MPEPRPDYRFARRPWWIVSHLFAAGMVVLMVNLGFWQLRRLDERRTHNALIESRQELPPAPLGELLPAGPASQPEEVAEVAYRMVVLRGRYALDEQVLVRNRTSEGLPGYWVVTPLVLDDGTAVAVNRGWVPFASTDPEGPWPQYDPPATSVTVTGMVQEPQVRAGGLVGGPVDAPEGRLWTLSRVDVGRLAQQVAQPMWPLYVNLASQEPAQGELPQPVPPPDLSEGPHLGYAGQWFVFAGLTVIVYPLLLRRVARHRGREAVEAMEA
ncbi:SURF1 family cytochrome oxidase biogenesis protein [Rhabdothermincola sp.]|uniref:SURF1 family cytochrome oxidase biogenesis protein n=1 Tax=Rhabdothermincola sp. TaxID=2820405 RepID=UPI002FDFBF7C